MLGCALCIFELEKRPMVLSQKGLLKLLHVLNFVRIMMQAFHQSKHLCWIIYNGRLPTGSLIHFCVVGSLGEIDYQSFSFRYLPFPGTLQIFKMCNYLMALNHSSKVCRRRYLKFSLHVKQHVVENPLSTLFPF